MVQDENMIGKLISVLFRCRKSYVKKRLEPYGISGGQFGIILALSKHDGISQEEICDHLRIDKTFAAKAMKNLEINEYIRRERDPHDGRAYNVFLTEKAVNILPLITETVKSWEDSVTSGFTQEEYHSVETLLKKMADNAIDLS